MCGACGNSARLRVADAQGARPSIPRPQESILPTINIARAEGWKSGERPTPAAGVAVNAFARGLSHPRWLYTLPNGDVLVAETDTPSKPEDFKGIKGKIYH